MRRGWCPTLYEPMPTGDGLLVRVKPPGGRLASDAARSLAQTAARFGNGTIELTRRGNLQIRGLTVGSVPHFAAAMVVAGLASADPAVERRRNVMSLPLAGDDPAAAADAAPLAAAIEAMLAAEPALAALPAKFGFAVDGGGVLGLAEPADIVVRTDGVRHWIVLGDVQAPCPPGVTVGIVRELALAAGARRMKDWTCDAELASMGLTHVPAPARVASANPVGFTRYFRTERGAFGIGLPFGETDARTLGIIAGLADRFSDGTLRVSPWRTVLLGSVRATEIHALRDAAEIAGLIAVPTDRRLHMAACIGSAGCASGTVRAREDAAALATAGWTGFLHVSGCAKGCAHPGTAALTLVGEAGRYNLVRDGCAHDPPFATGLTLSQAAVQR